MDRGVETLGTLGTVARIILVAFMAFAVLCTLAYGVILTAIVNPFSHDAMLISAGGFLLLLAAIGMMLLGFILIPLWTHRAHRNLDAAHVPNRKYTAGWAAGSFFVPFANLVVPFKAMIDLHNRSMGEDEWQADSAVGDVSSWQACTISAMLLFLVLAVIVFFGTMTNVTVVMPELGYAGLLFLLMLFAVGASWFLLRLIGKITAYQRAGLHLSQGDVFD